ncbi:MAG: hypothetical protein WC011_02305, partial [Candidatus Paceibacterota bacterium]
SSAQTVLDFFGVSERTEIGTGFHISELMYAPKEFLSYLKGLAEWGIRPSNCQGWYDKTIFEIKTAFYEGKYYSEMLGFSCLPDWVEDNLKGVLSYRTARIFKSFLIRNKADWGWQRKSLKFWYETHQSSNHYGVGTFNEAFNSIRELNTSFSHTWAAARLAKVGTPTAAETSSNEANTKVFSIYINGINLYAGLEKARLVSIEENQFQVAIFEGRQGTKIFFLWEEGNDFRYHFEGASIKEAYEKWQYRDLSTEEIIVKDGISFKTVDSMGYCLSGTKSFLERRAPFLYSLIKEYESQYNKWDTVPEEIMNLVFYPTQEFAQAIMSRY